MDGCRSLQSIRQTMCTTNDGSATLVIIHVTNVFVWSSARIDIIDMYNIKHARWGKFQIWYTIINATLALSVYYIKSLLSSLNYHQHSLSYFWQMPNFTSFQWKYAVTTIEGGCELHRRFVKLLLISLTVKRQKYKSRFTKQVHCVAGDFSSELHDLFFINETETEHRIGWATKQILTYSV